MQKTSYSGAFWLIVITFLYPGTSAGKDINGIIKGICGSGNAECIESQTRSFHEVDNYFKSIGTNSRKMNIYRLCGERHGHQASGGPDFEDWASCIGINARNNKRLADQKKKKKKAISDASKLINAKCKKEWTSNYRMQQFCREQQHEGFDAVVSFLKTNTSKEAKGIIVSCANKWGSNYRMMAFCIKQQNDALNTL